MTESLTRRSTLKSLAAGGAGWAVGSASGTSPALALDEARASNRDLRITDVRVHTLKFPGKTPRIRNSIIESGGGAPGMELLELHTNQGIVGHSMPKGPKSSILSRAFSRIEGQNPFDVERLWDRMFQHNNKPVAKGDYIKSIGSLDMAIWDIVGKALDMPVTKLLGGFHKQIRVYAAGGYYSEGKSVADLVKEMEGYVDEGFRAVKMKVGGISFNEDVERVRAVREGIGPGIDLMIDANNKWRAYEAIRFGRAVEKYDLFWFEEPVVPDDFAGCAEVRQALDVPIVAGENEFTRWGCRDLITAKSADILNPDTVKAGGITELRKIAALASAFHIPVAPHGAPEMAMHLVASTSNALIMETYPGIKSQYNPLLPLQPVADGHITVPDTPGLGLDVDPKLVAKYRV